MKRFRNTQFVSAIVFLLAAASFKFGNEGAQWTWKDTPIVWAILVVVSVVLWVFSAWKEKKSRRRDSQLSETNHSSRWLKERSIEKGIEMVLTDVGPRPTSFYTLAGAVTSQR